MGVAGVGAAVRQVVLALACNAVMAVLVSTHSSGGESRRLGRVAVSPAWGRRVVGGAAGS